MNFLKKIAIFLFFILIAVNIFYYLKMIKLGNELYSLENEISKLNVNNKKLERDISKIDNLSYLSSRAAEIGLTHQLKFWYLEPEKYALSK